MNSRSPVFHSLMSLIVIDIKSASTKAGDWVIISMFTFPFSPALRQVLVRVNPQRMINTPNTSPRLASSNDQPHQTRKPHSRRISNEIPIAESLNNGSGLFTRVLRLIKTKTSITNVTTIIRIDGASARIVRRRIVRSPEPGAIRERLGAAAGPFLGQPGVVLLDCGATTNTGLAELAIPRDDLNRIWVLRKVLNPLSAVESMELLIETPDGFSLGIVQIAGRLARRVVGDPEEGAPVEKGKRFGLIRFGSRVELFLPQEVSVSVQPGQNVKGGETVMGYFP